MSSIRKRRRNRLSKAQRRQRRQRQTRQTRDAISAVRRWLWVEWVFAIPGPNTAFSKLKRPFREMLLAGLAPAA